MAKRNANTIPLGLLVSTETTPSYRADDRGYFHIKASVVTLIDGAVRNGTTLYDGPYNGGLHRIEGLAVTSQGENSRADHGLYGFHVEFTDVRFVRTRDAEQIFRTLAFIDRRLSKIAAKRGDVRTFGEFVGRVAEVIGAETILFQKGKPRGWHDENEYDRGDIGGGVRRIELIEREWRQKFSEQQAVTA